MKGPILHSKDYKFVGEVYPWYVFKPTKEGVPELRYLSMATYIDDTTNQRTLYKPKLPHESHYVTKFN